MIIAFWIGLYPKPFFQILSTPVNNLVATVRPDYPGLTKPVVAAQPVKREARRGDSAARAAESRRQTQTPAPPATTSKPGVAATRKPAPVKTAQANLAAAPAAMAASEDEIVTTSLTQYLSFSSTDYLLALPMLLLTLFALGILMIDLMLPEAVEAA